MEAYEEAEQGLSVLLFGNVTTSLNLGCYMCKTKNNSFEEI